MQDYVQRLHLGRTGSWITFDRNPMLLDSTQRIINSIDFPKANNPIALIVIVESFVKIKESAYVNFVFFDTSSKEILWRLKFEGYTKNRGGMSSRWKRGMKFCFQGFFKYLKKESR